MKYDNLDLKNWKELDIDTDFCWITNEKDKNIYHSSFIPQIPNQSTKK